MPRSRRATFFAVFLPFFGGCAAERIGAHREPILGGEPNPGDPSVVLLLFSDSMCTGSVIDPFVILTARHCTQGVVPQEVEVHTGPDPLAGDGELLAAAGDIFDAVVPPDEGDIAIFRSGVDLGVPALPISEDFENPAIGDTITAIGYGQGDDVGGEGPKRRGQGVVEDVLADAFFTTAVTCYGDSGGPIFDEAGAIVGVVSAGTEDLCSTGEDVDVNVGYYAPFLSDWLDLGDPTPEPEPEPEPDPDPDPSGGVLGDACTEAADCASDACVVEDGYCTESCAGAECADGFECRGVGTDFYCLVADDSGGHGRRGSSCATNGHPRSSPWLAWPIALAALALGRWRRRS